MPTGAQKLAECVAQLARTPEDAKYARVTFTVCLNTSQHFHRESVLVHIEVNANFAIGISRRADGCQNF